jgi:hypothetical protein
MRILLRIVDHRDFKVFPRGRILLFPVLSKRKRDAQKHRKHHDQAFFHINFHAPIEKFRVRAFSLWLPPTKGANSEPKAALN